MPGLAIPLDTTLTGANFPVLRQDEILSDGSLMLLDVAHTYSTIGAGVPADNALLGNIAWQEAAALTGSDEAGVSAWFELVGGTGFSMERTGRGGLHFMVSQSGNLGANVGAEISLPTPIRAYLAANPAHAYYLSAWTRLTKAAQAVVSGVTYNPATLTVQRTVSATSNYLAYDDMTDAYPLAGNPKRLGVRQDGGVNTLGNRLHAIAADGWTGTPPAAASEVRPGLLIAGARGAYTALAASNGAPSLIVYRLYLEDLTVSGRSFAEVDAIDLAIHTRRFAAGGNLNGDTYTTPA